MNSKELLKMMSGSSKTWLRIRDDGFHEKDQDYYLPSLEGVIEDIHVYGVKWVNKKKETVSLNDNALPEGFKQAVDIQINQDGDVYCFTVENRAGLRNFNRYIFNLSKQGYSPNEVVTRVHVQSVQLNHLNYGVVSFEMVTPTKMITAKNLSTKN